MSDMIQDEVIVWCKCFLTVSAIHQFSLAA